MARPKLPQRRIAARTRSHVTIKLAPVRGRHVYRDGDVYYREEHVQRHRVRVWYAWLECGHVYEMPHGRRHVKERMGCHDCAHEWGRIEALLAWLASERLRLRRAGLDEPSFGDTLRRAEWLGTTSSVLVLWAWFQNDWAWVEVSYSHRDDAGKPVYVVAEGSGHPFAEGSLVHCVTAGIEKLAEFA